jgi:hypothetical protein
VIPYPVNLRICFQSRGGHREFIRQDVIYFLGSTLKIMNFRTFLVMLYVRTSEEISLWVEYSGDNSTRYRIQGWSEANVESIETRPYSSPAYSSAQIPVNQKDNNGAPAILIRTRDSTSSVKARYSSILDFSRSFFSARASGDCRVRLTLCCS